MGSGLKRDHCITKLLNYLYLLFASFPVHKLNFKIQEKKKVHVQFVS